MGTVTPAAFELKLAQQRALQAHACRRFYLDRPDEATRRRMKRGLGRRFEDGRADGADFVGDKISPDLRELVTGTARRLGARERHPSGRRPQERNAARLHQVERRARVGRATRGSAHRLVEVPAGAVARLSELRGVAHLSLDRPTIARSAATSLRRPARRRWRTTSTSRRPASSPRASSTARA
jgi:hypothetical protein